MGLSLLTIRSQRIPSCCHGRSPGPAYQRKVIRRESSIAISFASKHMALGKSSFYGCSPGKTSEGGRPGKICARRRSRGLGVRVQALFEQFTERSIKSIIYAQGFCREMGGSEVRC